MNDSVHRHFNATVQKTYEWLGDVETALGTGDRQVAYHALRSVLHALRDRLIPEEAADLAEQLPSLLRGIYYEGWSPANKPDKLNSRQFLDRVAENSSTAPERLDPEHCVRAVFEVLQQRIADGEISDIRGALPKKFADLWPPELWAGHRKAASH